MTNLTPSLFYFSFTAKVKPCLTSYFPKSTYTSAINLKYLPHFMFFNTILLATLKYSTVNC